jgi:hypothetical protein
MNSYSSVYRYTVNGHCKTPELLLEAIEEALAQHTAQLVACAERSSAFNSSSFAAEYAAAWSSFRNDMALIAVVCKYPLHRYDSWRGLLDSPNVAAMWTETVLAHPTIIETLRDLFTGMPQLQHLALHKCEDIAKQDVETAAELMDHVAAESARRGIAGCSRCLHTYGLATLVATPDRGSSFAALPN